MKIKFMIFGVLQPRREDYALGMEIEMPFVPRVGDQIAVVDEDDIREVEAVFWTPAEGIVVHFTFLESTPAGFRELIDAGWKREEA